MKPLQIGVCSWSLAITDLAKALATIKSELTLHAVQVGFFGDAQIPDETDHDRVVDIVRASGLTPTATCIGFEGEDYSTIQRIAATGGYVPDDLFEKRFAQTTVTAKLTAKLGLSMLATHVGFVPHDHDDPKYAVMVKRLRKVTDALADVGITLVMETGQEPVDTLIAFIDEVGRDNVRVNFDPANMVLYGAGEPVDAVTALRDRIVHVHMKDATWSSQPGKTWGQEVPLGDGDADIPRVVSKLRAIGYTGPLVIEREAGTNRLGDIRHASDYLESLLM
jgi:L-ribulose-5-phosphate 3-epimerase